MKKLILILFSILNTLYPNDYTIITHENGGTTWIPNTWETIPLSYLEQRQQFLEDYTKEHQLAPDVSLEKIALLSREYEVNLYSLDELVNLTVDFAHKRSSNTISMEDFDRAFDIFLKREEITDTRNAQRIWEVAVHEAGHALVCMLLTPEMLHKATIVPRRFYGGEVITLFDIEKNDMQTVCSDLIVSLAGATAEEIILNSSDAKLILTDSVPFRFIADYRYAKLTISTLIHKFRGDGVLTIDKNKKLSPEEESSYTHIILQRHYDKAKELIKNNKDTLIKIAKALVERKTLTEIEVKELLSSSQETVKKTTRQASPISHKKNLVYAAHAKRLNRGVKQKSS